VAAIFFTSVTGQLLEGWLVGTISCGAGIAASACWDLPTGAAVVAALGVSFALAVLGAMTRRVPG
jgi:ABC-type Mn2+/Zn2+ transport system permease subunit